MGCETLEKQWLRTGFRGHWRSLSQHEFSVQARCWKAMVNLRTIKHPKLGCDLSSVPSIAATVLCPVLVPTHPKRCDITGKGSKDGTHNIQPLENRPYDGKLNLPQLFREKVWNGLLLCVEGLAHGKTSEHAGQKKTSVTLQMKPNQVPVVGYWS